MLAKKDTFLEKGSPKVLPPLLLNPFSKYFASNKVLHNFYMRGQHPNARHIKSFN